MRRLPKKDRRPYRPLYPRERPDQIVLHNPKTVSAFARVNPDAFYPTASGYEQEQAEKKEEFKKLTNCISERDMWEMCV